MHFINDMQTFCAHLDLKIHFPSMVTAVRADYVVISFFLQFLSQQPSSD